MRTVTEEDVRRAALSLPETTEKLSYGSPGFRVRDRLFARIRDEYQSVVVWCADVAEKEALVRSRPEHLFTTPHYDGRPTVLVRMAAVDPDEMAEPLAEPWRLRAPARLAARFEGRYRIRGRARSPWPPPAGRGLRPPPATRLARP
ncbi:MAG TPA: MmcQ/YjbR family DNA-binding protein [Acidimicrobiales bacterium]|nr:MmcQ/YjbR family DNA-binding protein [Acidimicrobiales bacterium]